MDIHKLPQHVAIIMDGNGRWAEARNMPRTNGHLEGVKRVEELITTARILGIKVLTFFTFSTENWSRPQGEVSMLMKTLSMVLNSKVKELNKTNIRLQCIGRREGAPADVLKSFDAASELTKNNTGMVVNIAFNYGGRQEILDGVQQVLRAVGDHTLEPDAIDEQTFGRFLYTRGLPDPDLLIRTSGEKRISNFLLWQLSYAEFYFTEKCWPEFTENEFIAALEDYQQRERRYGSVGTARRGS